MKDQVETFNPPILREGGGAETIHPNTLPYEGFGGEGRRGSKPLAPEITPYTKGSLQTKKTLKVRFLPKWGYPPPLGLVKFWLFFSSP